MLPNLAAILVGVLLLTFQGSLLFPDPFGVGAPDLFICLVAYLGMQRDLPGGAIPLLVVGLLADIFAGTPPGLHLVTAAILFLLLQLLQLRLVVRGLGTGVVLVVLTSLASSVLIWMLAAIFVPRFSANIALLRFAFLRALITAPFAVPVLWGMARLDSLGPAGRSKRSATAYDLTSRKV